MPFAVDELSDRAARFGDRLAMRVDGQADRTLTYAEWDAQAHAVAANLAALGVERGDRVVLLCTNAEADDFAVGYLGAQRAGAVAVPVNPRYAPAELAHVLADSGAQVVVADSQASRVAGHPGVVVRTRAQLATGDRSPVAVELGPDDLAEIFYTSGTTGLPRGVVSTHANSAHHDLSALDGGGVLLHAIPLATFTGVQGGILTPLRLAITTVVLPRFDVGRFAELIELDRPLWLLMVPAHILLVLEAGALEGRDTSSVAIAMFGGAPTPPAVVERLGQLLPGAMLFNGYGLTEGGGSVCVLPPGEAALRPGSVGRPMAGVEVRIVVADDASGDGDDAASGVGDLDELFDVEPGEVGEIVLRLPAGERRYWNDPEATARTWRRGWVHTGDLGRLDDDGFLYVVDRAKDVIIRGGYNIASVEVESAIHALDQVAECAVVAVPHPVLDQDVAAVVRWNPGATPLELDELRDQVSDALADYKRPRHLVTVTEPLPRNASGKLDKKAIARLAAESIS